MFGRGEVEWMARVRNLAVLGDCGRPELHFDGFLHRGLGGAKSLTFESKEEETNQIVVKWPAVNIPIIKVLPMGSWSRVIEAHGKVEAG